MQKKLNGIARVNGTLDGQTSKIVFVVCICLCVCGGGEIDFKELFYSNHLSQGNLFRVIN